MKTQPKWQYDEMKQCGVDFANPVEVERYNESHGRLENYKQQAGQIIEQLGVKSEHVVMDMGCGTGGFTFYMAQKCGQVVAVDVSQAMLDFCKVKCEKAGLSNIEYHNAGFLTYEHVGEPVDAIVCRLVLHHLPDFWKQIALKRMAKMLKARGKLYLFDVVFSFDINNCNESIQQWIEATVASGGDEFKERIETHISKEFSTSDWIMEGLLERAGFKIEKRDYKDGFLADYLCVKHVGTDG